MAKRSEKAKIEIAGKYMFFASNRDLLVEVAIAELGSGGFHEAKIHMGA